MKQQYKVILEVDSDRDHINNEIELENALECLFNGLTVFKIEKIEDTIKYNYICFVDYCSNTNSTDFVVTDLKGNEVYNKLRVWDQERVNNEIIELFKNNVKFVNITECDINKDNLPEWCRGIRARYYAQNYNYGDS